METHLHHTADSSIRGNRYPNGLSFYHCLYPCSTGMTSLDKYLRGFKAGHYTLLSAPSNHGKTNLALKLAYAVARNTDFPGEVRFYSSDQDPSYLYTILACSIAGYQLKEGLPADKQMRLRQALREVRESPFTIINAQDMKAEDIAADVRRHRCHGPCKLVVVDFIRRVRSEISDHNLPIQERLTKISEKLRLLAYELQVHVLALNQLLPPSGITDQATIKDIWYDEQTSMCAAAHLFLERPETELFPKEPVEPDGKAWLHVLTNKYGPTGTIKLHWDAEKLRFSEVLS